MQKTILFLVLSLFSLFFLEQVVANDVRLCLPTTDASASFILPNSTSNTSISASFSVVTTNAAGTYLWAIANSTVYRFPLNSGIPDASRAITIGKATCSPVQRRSICNPYSVHVDSNDNLWVADKDLRRVLEFVNASNATYTGILQRPSRVIGAGDWTNVNTAGSINNFNLSGPEDVVYYADTDTLFVLDADDGTAARVLVYDSISTQTNFRIVADRVLGQKDFTTLVAGTSSSSLGYAEGLSVDQTNGDLYVADSSNNRVLKYESADTKSSGDSADHVIGQSSTSGSAAGTTSKTLTFPISVNVDPYGNQLFIADNDNSRIVVVHGVQSLSSNGPTFTTVIGQSSFTTGLANQGGSVAANTLNNPVFVNFNNVTGYIYVADTRNNRVTLYGPCLVDKATPSISGSKQSVSGTPASTGTANATSTRSFNSSQVVTTSPSTTLVSGSPSTSVASVSPSTSPISFPTTGGSTGTTGTTGARRLRRRF
jgi:hypothetical protein